MTQKKLPLSTYRGNSPKEVWIPSKTKSGIPIHLYWIDKAVLSVLEHPKGMQATIGWGNARKAVGVKVLQMGVDVAKSMVLKYYTKKYRE